MAILIPRLTAAASRCCQRRYATHAAQVSVSQINGMNIVSSDEGRPTSTISVIFKAGSRYEPSPGMSHVLKNLVFKATNKRSALSLIREVEHLGGVLTSSFGREHLVLSAEFLRGDEGYFTELLGDVVSCSKFLPHEYAEEVVPQVASEYEQASQDLTLKAYDLAHQLAFRKGLGNSLFASPHTAISHDAATSYALTALGQSSSMAVVASGVSNNTLGNLVSEFFQPQTTTSSSSPSSVTQYYGGEIRVPHTSHGDLGELLVAFKGASRSSPEYAVVQQLLGGHSNLKWTQGTGRFSSLSTKNVKVNAFNLAYSDAGLVGFHVSAPTAQIEATATTALGELKKISSGVDAQEVKKAIAKAKFAVAASLETGLNQTEALGTLTLDAGAPSSLEDLYRALDSVTPAKVSEAATAALKSRPTTVTIGDTHRLPYSDAFAL